MSPPAVAADVQHNEVADVPVFKPMSLTIDEIRKAIPPHLFKRSTSRAMGYLVMNIALAIAAWGLATRIDDACAYLQSPASVYPITPLAAKAVKATLWCLYWWYQGLIHTGFWVLGHECGHGGFSDSKAVCNTVGFLLHSYLLTPYYGWKVSHHKHHMNHASMERDETWVPLTRSEMNIPEELEPGHKDFEEIFGDTPMYTLAVLVVRQAIAFPVYLLFNVSGNKEYPKWTNHFDPNSVLFKKSQRAAVLISDLGVIAMLCVVQAAVMKFGWWEVMKYYGIPWVWVSHWLVMITYLHHTDPQLPHYRNAAWTYSRGAAATMDRDFLGWSGRFFLHGISHHHVVHHFFPKMPWYKQEEATGYLKQVLGDQYHYSDIPVFKALWHSYNNCQFVEDKGNVLFYRNKSGRAVVKSVEESAKHD